MGVAQIKMPQLGESVTEGTVEKWLKREGEFVKRDEPIVEVVTDKVNAEIPSPFEGTLVKIDAGEGQVVRVGAVIAQIETTAAAAAAAPAPATPKAAPAPAAAPAAAPAPTAAPAQRAPGGEEHARLSPAVRKLAAERGIDPTSIQGSGLGGRVTREDVLAAPAAPAAPARSAAPAPPSAPAKLLGRALKQFPWLNSTWTDEGVVLKRYLNLGIAVSIPDGLTVPVLKDADQLGFSELVRRINDLIERSRNKQLKPEDVQGGTFTLNNTGATGSVASQPIINQPQAAILTTEAIVKRPVVIGEGIAVRDMMNMCLSFDHRIIDGMMAGQFLTFMKQGLEEWTPASIRL